MPYFAAHADKLTACGAKLNDDGSEKGGGIFIFDTEDRAEAEALVAALYDSQRPPLLAAAFRKRLQRAVANTRSIWKRRHGDDRTG